MVVEEAKLLLEEVKSIFEFGKPAGSVSIGPRTMKETMNPVKQKGGGGGGGDDDGVDA